MYYVGTQSFVLCDCKAPWNSFWQINSNHAGNEQMGAINAAPYRPLTHCRPEQSGSNIVYEQSYSRRAVESFYNRGPAKYPE